MIGQTISHYRVLEKLGGGGMGVVYRAEDTKLGRVVALKFLPAELSHDPEAKARFVREARAASALDHPNICAIHEIGESDDGRLFIAMNSYDGETLKQKIERGPLPLHDVLIYTNQIADGLAAAHDRGIVHRDIKPANLMVTNDGLVKILDFGLAKLVNDSKITQSRHASGTPAYMSPEQIRGEAIDCRTDLWSLGVVLFEMITAQRPFRGDSDHAVTHSILDEPSERIDTYRSDVPPQFQHVVARALRKDERVRYGSAHDLIADLGAPATGIVTATKVRVRFPRARRRPLWLVGAVTTTPDRSQLLDVDPGGIRHGAWHAAERHRHRHLSICSAGRRPRRISRSRTRRPSHQTDRWCGRNSRG